MAGEAFNTGSSKVVERCQTCDYKELQPLLFLGYLPPVNKLNKIGEKPHEQSSYPAQLLYCPRCHLVQLGLIVDAKILFPPEYPYTSSTTKILRENFADLYKECSAILDLSPNDLIVDIGSNDGNLLSNFMGKHKVLGITPEEIGRIAIERGIPTIIDYFNKATADQVLKNHGKAKIVTATNVFAHIEDPNTVLENIIRLMKHDSFFISESHYLLPLIETLQYDTVYHEHLRYYSLHSIKYLLEYHGLEILHARRIPTHGGSIRVYAGKKDYFKPNQSVEILLEKERRVVTDIESLRGFKDKVMMSKLKLYELLSGIKENGGSIFGISAPSRASTLVNYVGLDDGIIDAVVEVKGSHKIGNYVPGTLIPILDEAKLFQDQPEYALLFSWHIADELIPKLKELGYKGKFIVPLPEPRVIV